MERKVLRPFFVCVYLKDLLPEIPGTVTGTIGLHCVKLTSHLKKREATQAPRWKGSKTPCWVGVGDASLNEFHHEI